MAAADLKSQGSGVPQCSRSGPNRFRKVCRPISKTKASKQASKAQLSRSKQKPASKQAEKAKKP